MKDKDQKLIFEAYQQLNEIGGGGSNPSGRPEDIGTETFDQDDEYEHVQNVIDQHLQDGAYPTTDEGWDELFNSVWDDSDIREYHSDILSELLDRKRKEIEDSVRDAEIQSAQPGLDMDAAGNMWNPYS